MNALNSVDVSARVSVRTRAAACLILAAVASLGTAGPLQAQQGFVEVARAGEAPVTHSNVVIVSETLTEVTLRQRNRDRSVPTPDVIRVSYGRGSDAFEAAASALGNNDLDNAVNLFGSAANDTEPGWVAAVALLKQADAAARTRAGPARAAQILEQFAQRFPDHRRLPEALLATARYAAAAGSVSDAGAPTAQLKAMTSARQVTPDWGVRAALLMGELFLEAGDTRKASEQFAEAEQNAELGKAQVGTRGDLVPELDGLGLRARVGAGSCLLADGKIDQARSFYQRLQNDGGDNVAVASAATNGLAECDFLAGNRYKEAQLGFAQVAVTAAGVPDEHARALYYLGRCTEELAEQGKENNGAMLSRKYFDEVTSRYPDSRWARLAQSR